MEASLDELRQYYGWQHKVMKALGNPKPKTIHIPVEDQSEPFPVFVWTDQRYHEYQEILSGRALAEDFDNGRIHD